jgi:hypothetical protein
MKNTVEDNQRRQYEDIKLFTDSRMKKFKQSKLRIPISGTECTLQQFTLRRQDKTTVYELSKFQCRRKTNKKVQRKANLHFYL